MKLPDYVNQCIEALETQGFAAYAVGGCVRDACLGRTPQDYDLCTSALPEEMEEVFRDHRLVLAGKKHGTVGVITDGGVVEITTFRTEGDYRDNRHPDWVAFVTDIDQDLARRDYTINAMAYSPSRGFRDPFGGREDLRNRLIRAVGEPERRFREDSLRILRGLRFSARYGFSIEKDTFRAMKDLAPLMDNLARERVFEELCKLLPVIGFRDLIAFGPVLGTVIPELRPMMGFQQHSPHHAFDVYTHTACVVSAVPGDLALRWAALLHDVGKPATFTRDPEGIGHFYGHAQVGAELAEEILRRLKAPTALREEVAALVGSHITRFEPTKKALRRLVSRLGWDTTEKLFTLQAADLGGKGIDGREADQRMRDILKELRQEESCLRVRDLKVSGHDLMALGYEGRAIGRALEDLLEQVLEERLPNEREELLRYLQN